nr:MAG TPA: hypothetical protein [Caudoviricetes sp.]
MALSSVSSPQQLIDEVNKIENDYLEKGSVLNTKSTATDLPYSANFVNDNFAITQTTIATALGLTTAQLGYLIEFVKQLNSNTSSINKIVGLSSTVKADIFDTNS